MALIKSTYLDYEVKGRDRFIQVKRVTEIIDDSTGEVISISFHRDTVNPDDDTKAAKFGDEITNIANLVWTPQVRANYRAKKAAQNS